MALVAHRVLKRLPLVMRDHGRVEKTSRTVIAFDGIDTHEAIIFDDLNVAADWMEAVDVDEGGYEKIAWFDDGEVIEVGVEQVARADLRVKLTATGRHDLPALREALARTRPDLRTPTWQLYTLSPPRSLPLTLRGGGPTGTAGSVVGCAGDDLTDSRRRPLRDAHPYRNSALTSTRINLSLSR